MVTWKGMTYGPAANTADSIPQWDGANTNVLKDGKTIVTTVGSPGVDTALPTDQAVREALANMPTRHSSTSEGTGADQEISHGFAAAPKRLEMGPLASDDLAIVFTSLTVEATHFHVTASTGLHFYWIAESW